MLKAIADLIGYGLDSVAYRSRAPDRFVTAIFASNIVCARLFATAFLRIHRLAAGTVRESQSDRRLTNFKL